MIRRFLGRSGVLGCQQPRAAKPALPCLLVTELVRGPSLRVGGKGFFEVHSCRIERLEARSLLLPEPVLSPNEGFYCWKFKSICKGQALVTRETLSPRAEGLFVVVCVRLFAVKRGVNMSPFQT